MYKSPHIFALLFTQSFQYAFKPKFNKTHQNPTKPTKLHQLEEIPSALRAEVHAFTPSPQHSIL